MPLTSWAGATVFDNNILDVIYLTNDPQNSLAIMMSDGVSAHIIRFKSYMDCIFFFFQFYPILLFFFKISLFKNKKFSF